MSEELRVENRHHAQALAANLRALGASACRIPVLLEDEMYEVDVRWLEVVPESEEPEQPVLDERPLLADTNEQIWAVSEVLNMVVQSQPDEDDLPPHVERLIEGLRAAITTLVVTAQSNDEHGPPR